ncbi:LPXTG cell wall anchor domain-containing protein [Streptococcus sp. zg-JUN1979]|uniref:LPXTG cell wall anchor domain-containing protein n=1 Tax=Streptococcus sp. zg-JUN1979 TaxID=3391450 RepID=UPI0039A417D8
MSESLLESNSESISQMTSTSFSESISHSTSSSQSLSDWISESISVSQLASLSESLVSSESSKGSLLPSSSEVGVSPVKQMVYTSAHSQTKARYSLPRTGDKDSGATLLGSAALFGAFVLGRKKKDDN